jgi:phosphate uptake regulator
MSPSRRLLDREETTIYKNLLSMYAATDKAIERAIDCLRTQDTNLARQVAEDDEKINELQRLIEEECLEAIATQQPRSLRICILLMSWNASPTTPPILPVLYLVTGKNHPNFQNST